jgi:hypothetical protein
MVLLDDHQTLQTDDQDLDPHSERVQEDTQTREQLQSNSPNVVQQDPCVPATDKNEGRQHKKTQVTFSGLLADSISTLRKSLLLRNSKMDCNSPK